MPGTRRIMAEYYRKAIGVFEQIEKQDMADYDTEYNMAVLYQNIHDYASAENKLNHILDVIWRKLPHI